MNYQQDSKDKLINAAIDRFAAQGFSGTSIRDIANAMGMSISNIYHYFGNKEGLLLAVLQRASEHLLEALTQAIKSDNEPLPRFRLLLETHVCMAVTYTKESRIFSQEQANLSAEGNEYNKRIQRQILNLYRDELRKLQDLGLLGGYDLTLLAFNIFGMINSLLRWYQPQGALPLEKVTEDIVSLVLHGMLAQPRERDGAGASLG